MARCHHVVVMLHCKAVELIPLDRAAGGTCGTMNLESEITDPGPFGFLDGVCQEGRLVLPRENVCESINFLP